MYKIDKEKEEWIKQFPKMEFDPDARYIILCDSLEKSKAINEACEVVFGDSFLDYSLPVGNGVVIRRNVVLYNPDPEYPCSFIDPDVFIVQFHPDYHDREVVEVMGKKYYKDDLEKRLSELDTI